MEIGELDWQHRQELIDRLHQVQRSIGELKAEEKFLQLQLSALNIRLGRNLDDVFARVFKQCARRFLTHDVYEKIIDKVHEKLKWADRRVEGEDDIGE